VRIVFMGTPQFAVPSLQRLARSEHSIVGVVTQPDRPAGRGQRLRPSPVKELAQKLGVPVLQPARARSAEFLDQLRGLAPDIAVVVAYGQILPVSVIAVPPLGCINAHASLLPHLRGAAPIQRAILAGDSETGVTVMRINERMDAGDVLSARAVEIDAGDDAATLGAKLSSIAADLLVEAVALIARGADHWTAQDDTVATYAPMIRREETRIDWSLPAEHVERQIRAFRPDPGAYTTHGGTRLKILAATVGPGDALAPPGTVEVEAPEGVRVACGNGSLTLTILQPEGGRPMPAIDYFRGRGAGRGRIFGERAA
jgi:methionyl-tRNA formyltransferase